MIAGAKYRHSPQLENSLAGWWEPPEPTQRRFPRLPGRPRCTGGFSGAPVDGARGCWTSPWKRDLCSHSPACRNRFPSFFNSSFERESLFGAVRISLWKGHGPSASSLQLRNVFHWVCGTHEPSLRFQYHPQVPPPLPPRPLFRQLGNTSLTSVDLPSGSEWWKYPISSHLLFI